MLSLLVKDLGDQREVTVHGRVFYDGAWHTDGVTFRSFYRRETLHALFEAKGAYLYDEIRRVEDSLYVREQFIGFLKRQTSLPGKMVLDFGSGCGSSTIFLAREGAAVTAVELMSNYRQAARLRLEDEKLADRASVIEADDMDHLPFPKESFDLITMSAVLEHIHPLDRKRLLGMLADFLRPGGLFVITETPNRLWPYDGHTTRLPFTSWMPLQLACKVARVLRPAEFAHKSQDELIYDGIVGATWFGAARMIKPLRPAQTSPREEYHAYFSRLLKRKTGLALLLARCLRLAFYPLMVFLMFFSRRFPINALFPYLNMAFEKPL